MNGIRSEVATVFTSYTASSEHASGLSVAQFVWPNAVRPEDTYTIDLDGITSLELDRRSPVRPYGLRLYDDGSETVSDELTELVGEELTRTLLKTRNCGMMTVHVSLSETNRFAIASLQAASPSTPPQLRQLCEIMGQEHRSRQTSGAIQRTRGDRPSRSIGSRTRAQR